MDCQEDDGLFSDITVDETDIPTVFDVSWTSSEPVRSQLVFAVDAGEPRETGLSEAEDELASVLLRGLPASHDVTFRVVSEDGRCSAEQSATTGALDSALPILEHVGEDTPEHGFVFAPVILSGAQYLTVIDHKGRFVWAQEVLGGLPYRLEAAVDGEGLLFMRAAPNADEYGVVARLAWDGTQVWEHRALGIHTDFARAEDGLIYYLSWRAQHIEYNGEDRKILDDRVFVFDPETGEEEVIWSVMGTWAPNLDVRYEAQNYQGDPDAEDYAHVNGLSIDEDHDAVLMSVAGFQSVISIDRWSGATNWALGDNQDSLDLGTQTDLIMNPHSVFRRPDDKILVFNRNSMGQPGNCSDAVVIDVDLDAGSASEVQSIAGEECLSVYFLGQARPRVEGGTTITWTTSGRIEHFDEDGTSTWQVTADLGAGFAYTDMRDGLY